MNRISQTVKKIFEFFSTSANALTLRASSYWSGLGRQTGVKYSWERADYLFWRKAYYCKAKGLEIAGLFIKPLVNKIAAWTLGRPVHWKLESETAAEALAEWWKEQHPTVLMAWRSALKEGDAFLFFNPDGTLTAVNADLVEPMVDDNDYSQLTGWKVVQTFTHPEKRFEQQTVTDEYTIDGRTRIWERNGAEFRRENWPNPLGLLPVVHIPNQPTSGERFGHPEAEALVTALQRYGATLEAALDGNQLQGRPTPVLTFETVEGYNQFWDDYGESESQQLPDGTTQTVSKLSVDLSQLMAVAGAKFSYESPGSFAADTIRLLEIIFMLVLEHTELPEFVFGNAIASSKASAETQMPVFIRFIEVKRAEMGGWLQDLAEIALAYLALINPAAGTAEKPALQWEQLEQDDGRLSLEVVAWAFAEGLIDRRTALMLAPVDVDDIDAVLAEAAKEQQAKEPPDPAGQEIDRFFRREILAEEN